MPRDKTGLDGAAWENLDPRTAIAQRRETTTGAEARSRDNRTYLEATSPRPKSTVQDSTETDFGRLTALTTRGVDENRRAFLTKITKGIMEPDNGTIGKANTGGMKVKKEKDTPDVGKAEAGSAAILFDKKLFYVLTTILRLQLDDRHSYIREYLRLRTCEYWEDLENHILGDYVAVEDPETGKIHTLPERDCKLFSKLERFMADINNDEPLSWTLSMWRNWRIQADVSTVGIPSTIGERSGTTPFPPPTKKIAPIPPTTKIPMVMTTPPAPMPTATGTESEGEEEIEIVSDIQKGNTGKIASLRDKKRELETNF